MKERTAAGVLEEMAMFIYHAPLSKICIDLVSERQFLRWGMITEINQLISAKLKAPLSVFRLSNIHAVMPSFLPFS